ncbi:MAG: transcriptional regulator, TetR family [Deltaproteobacteria bacterium]|nr:transcriptional regulator, TetR family [Deltaproteobacteria bacterium]
MDISKRQLTVLDQISASDTVRKKIIDAASLLYAKKGFSATSIEEISEMAGVSLPVTYRYARKKAEIMKMIMEDVLNSFKENLTRQIGGVDHPRDKLATAVVLYSKIVDREQDKILLMYQKSGSLDAPSKGIVMQLEVVVSEIFSEIIKEGIQKGLFRKIDVDLMAFNIMMMSHMWVLKRWHFRKRLTLEAFMERQLALILEVLHADPSGPLLACD